MSVVEVYLQGNQMIARATWQTESVAGSGDYNTLTDPTVVTFTARRRTPAGTLEAAISYVFGVASEVTKASTGIFELKFVPAPGRWYIHAQGTGAAYGSERAVFEIDESEALAA